MKLLLSQLLQVKLNIILNIGLVKYNSSFELNFMILILDSHHQKLEQSLTADPSIHETYFESSDDGYAIMPNGAFISLVFGKY